MPLVHMSWVTKEEKIVRHGWGIRRRLEWKEGQKDFPDRTM